MNKRADQGLTTRQHIVSAATRQFAKPGYEGTSIEALLVELEISRGALYHHFASKEALFEAVLETVEADLAKAIMSAGRGIADPVERLRAGCGAWLRLAQDPVIRQIVLIDAPSVVGWQKWREIDARHGFGLLKTSLEAAARAGRLNQELIDVLAHMLLAALMEAALVISRAEKPVTAMRVSKAAIDKLIDGMLAPR
jgi:AcrR family transcriptional regulator